MKKKTIKILKGANELRIEFHYESLSLRGATVYTKSFDGMNTETEEQLTREQIINYIFDGMIARAKGFDVD